MYGFKGFRPFATILMVIVLLLTCAAPILAQEDDDGVTEFGSGEIEINYWNGFTGPGGGYMVDLVQDFVEANPDVSVKMQMIPWDTYFDKLAASLVAGSGGPDMFILWHSIVPQYAVPGHIMPIADMMFEQGMIDPEDFSPQLLDGVTINGERYTMPLDHYGTGMYVNVALLEEAGIDPNEPPTTQEEFLDYARRLTWDVNGNHPGDEGFDPENVDVWGYKIGWPRATMQPALYQWGTDVISREEPIEVLFNSEEAIAATQFFVDLVHEYHVAPPEGFNVDEAVVNNKIAMFPDGSWYYDFFNINDELDIVMWPYPTLGPENNATIGWAHTMAVPSNIDPEKLDATMRLIQYLSDYSEYMTIYGGQPPARLSIRTPELFEQVWSIESFNKQFQEAGVMEYQSEYFSEIDDAIGAAWTAALTQQMSVEDALNDAAERIERIIH